MNALVVFVEITSYNLARVNQVYEQIHGWKFNYVYCSESISGHEYTGSLPEHAAVLKGNNCTKMRQLYSILRAVKYDFIIINGYSDLLNWQAICHAKRYGIPYAIETDTQLQVPQSFARRIMKRMILSFFFSGNAYGFAGGTRQKEVFIYYGMDEKRIHVMPMCIDVDEFSKIASRNTKDEYKVKYGFHKKKIILFAGRFVPVKNLPELLESITQLKKGHTDFICCLVGKGEESEKLEQIVRAKGIQDVVRFFPYKKNPELAEWYAMADVFVLPSSFEPWGLVVNEALASGTPVIVSDKVGAGTDLIMSGKNGDVYPLGNKVQLTTLLEKWLYNAPVHQDFSIVDRWNFANYLFKLQSLLSRI